MSTKIYFGKKCKTEDFVRLLQAMREESLADLRRRVAKFESTFEAAEKAVKQYAGKYYAQCWVAQQDEIYLCMSPMLYRVCDGMDGLEEFSYWDNSDKPEEVTDEKWMARRDGWYSVLIDAKDDAGQFVVEFVREMEIVTIVLKDES